MDDGLFAIEGVDALFDAEPADFVAARDALAKQLKAAGDKVSAAAVKKLTKPSIVAWAVNQVARRDPARIDELLQAGARVREAQADAVRGEDAAKLRSASRTRRELVQAVVEHAVALAGATHRDDVGRTVEAASLDDDFAVVLRAGRLTRALEPVSDFGLAGMPDPPAASPRTRPAEPEPVREEKPAARADDNAAALRRATEELDAAEVALATAEERVGRADEQLDAAMHALQQARSDRDAAMQVRDAAIATTNRLRGVVR